jgi:hypothetical protein
MLNRIRLSIMAGLCFVVGTLTNAQTHDHAAMAASNGEFNPYVTSDNHGGFFIAYVERNDGVSNVLYSRASVRVRVRIAVLESDLHEGI